LSDFDKPWILAQVDPEAQFLLFASLFQPVKVKGLQQNITH
jgi:hypothetical protein